MIFTENARAMASHLNTDGSLVGKSYPPNPPRQLLGFGFPFTHMLKNQTKCRLRCCEKSYWERG